MDHKFVETIPSELENNILYVSLEYNVTKHLCPCGCGSEIVATLSPTRWQLYYDGETVSLTPSIGNWQEKCQSHYIITNDDIIWANSMSKQRIDAAIQKDQKDLNEYVNTKDIKKKSWIERIINRLKSY